MYNCSDRTIHTTFNCPALAQHSDEMERDIRYLEEELLRPDAHETGIDLWSVNFDKADIISDILPSLKASRENLLPVLEQVSSDAGNRYKCPHLS